MKKKLLAAPVLIFTAVVESSAVPVPRAPAVKAPAASPASAPSAPALKILSDTVLSQQPLRWAADVRWASDHSVVLALHKSGVAEYNLDNKSLTKQWISGDQAPGGFWDSRHVAISSKYLVAGSWIFTMTWRPLNSEVRKEEAFEGIHDLDVQGSKAVVIGPRRDPKGEFSPDGAIVWIGSLDKDLTDLKPLLFDAGGPRAPSMNACGTFMLGAARFLADGSLLVVPGVQPGIYHFDSNGKLFQTLDTVALGIDTDCGGISREQGARMAHDVPLRLAWINQRRIVDDVLPLPAGPGLLIRSVHEGEVRWVLKVLHPNGSVAAYEVPIHGLNAFSHLKGDFRQGRLVLLLWGNPPNRHPEDAPFPHILIASPPGS